MPTSSFASSALAGDACQEKGNAGSQLKCKNEIQCDHELVCRLKIEDAVVKIAGAEVVSGKERGLLEASSRPVLDRAANAAADGSVVLNAELSTNIEQIAQKTGGY